MQEINMRREELLDIVRENRTKHEADYVEALEDYKSVVLKLTTQNLKIAKTGDVSKFSQIKNVPPSPSCYLKEYDRAIRMLELSADDVISVDQHIFNQLVLDEWAWKQSFAATSMAYKSM